MKINDYLQSRMSLLSIDNTLGKETEKTQGSSMSFMDTLKEKLDKVNEKQIQSDVATESFIKGEDIDIHEVMLITEEAKMSLQLAVQVRNKIVEAYQEISRMQL
ncbi:flagellar hook-basal body complex protein FliE [Clostridium thermarum]|uniref:flagellar hook-basal body complex protein FliE n=1 Tax=Clostridium thermarum TaxID=1716543 RepID=UPI001123B90D|nr:flagellar hook-basal body complex protein FliE [Clostridium thermarum]